MAIEEDAYLLRDFTRDLLLAGRLWRKLARAAASRHGMSEAASAPLIWIDRLGENVRQNALAEAVGIEGPSLVRLLDELQASGMVVRAPDPTDRRANSVSLTEFGRKVVKEVNDDLLALRARVFAEIPADDLKAALRTFAVLKQATEEGA